MRKVLAGIVAAGLILTYAHSGFAAEKKKTAAVPQAPVLSDQERAQIGSQSVQQLSSQQWTIYLVPQGAAAHSVETDVLTFSGTTVSSAMLAKAGYGGSNFSLNVQDDGGAVWETVQRTEENDIAMWRGEYRAGGLNGVLNMRTAQGVNKAYSFSTAIPEVKAVPAAPVKVEPQKKSGK